MFIFHSYTITTNLCVFKMLIIVILFPYSLKVYLIYVIFFFLMSYTKSEKILVSLDKNSIELVELLIFNYKIYK